eukprot:6297488-Ditylum_brightwellii.AAC.1
MEKESIDEALYCALKDEDDEKIKMLQGKLDETKKIDSCGVFIHSSIKVKNDLLFYARKNSMESYLTGNIVWLIARMPFGQFIRCIKC